MNMNINIYINILIYFLFLFSRRLKTMPYPRCSLSLFGSESTHLLDGISRQMRTHDHETINYA